MVATARERAAARAGVTLLEAVITMGLLGVVISSVALVTDSSSKAFRTGVKAHDLDQAAGTALDKIRGHLEASSANNVFPTPVAPFSTAQVDFQKGVGFQNQAIVWGPPEQIVLEYEPSETPDGIDNDGDGLIDECQIAWIENPGLPNQRRTVLATRVREFLEGEVPNGVDDNGNGLIDERGLCFDFEADRVTFRLTLEGADPEGTTIIRTVQRTVSFRNRGN